MSTMAARFLLFLFSILVILTTCVKPYNPVIDKYERVLVIDGTLTDDGAPPVVSLSYSSNVKVTESEKVSGAVVYIMSSDGQRFDLVEKSPGNYTYMQPMFAVTIGTSYQLVVENDGAVFKSTMDKMLPSTPITDISFVVKDNLKGVDLLISTAQNEVASRYYVWRLTETWKFRSPIFSEKRSVNKQVCYATTRDELCLATTELFENNSFTNHPFLYIPATSPRLFMRYSILVEQMSVSRNSFMYLSHVKKTSTSVGSLFDPIPANMNGNITSTNTPVIGNFLVSSVKSKRIYVDRSDLPNNLMISSGMEDCSLVQVPLNDRHTRDSLKNILYGMDTIELLEEGRVVKYERFVTGKHCFDCTSTGSPNKAPDWWEEKK